MFLDSIVRRLFGRKEVFPSKEVERLKRLPKDQARKELAAVAYEICVKLAADFVKDVFDQADTPFQGAPLPKVFHEMLSVTFWIMDVKVTGGKKTFMNELHDNYFRFFYIPGALSEDRTKELMEKYKAYENTWNDVSGHQDVFGLKVTQYIFGLDESNRTRERTFWIIKYAHDIMDEFVPLKKAFSAAGLAS